jgi:hypothetical protein
MNTKNPAPHGAGFFMSGDLLETEPTAVTELNSEN